MTAAKKPATKRTTTKKVTEAAKDAAFALPLGLLSNWKKLSEGAKIAYKSMLSPAMLKALTAWELAGTADDINQSTQNGETNKYIQ